MVTPGTEADVIISPEDVIARCLEVIALSGVIKSSRDVITTFDEVVPRESGLLLSCEDHTKT